VTEGSQEESDFIFFGYIIGHEAEWGYFSLAELESVGGGRILPVERDLYFDSGSFEEVIARFRKERGE
jgi:hypothetical protein